MQPSSIVDSPPQPPLRNADSQLPTIQSKIWKRYSDRFRKSNPAPFHPITSPAMNWLGTRSVWPVSWGHSYGFKKTRITIRKGHKGHKGASPQLGREKSHAKTQREKRRAADEHGFTQMACGKHRLRLIDSSLRPF